MPHVRKETGGLPSARPRRILDGSKVSKGMFAHDVEGNSIRGGNFMEDRKSATMALNGNYLQSFQFGLSYTWFWGAGLRNYLSDRDHASFSVKYAF